MSPVRWAEVFARFVRSRGLGHHFRRHHTLEGLRQSSVSKEIPAPLAQDLARAAGQDPGQLLLELGAHSEGLTEAQAQSLKTRFGPNIVEQDKALPWWRHLWHSYRTPFDLLLTLLAAVSYFTEDLKATVVIGLMVLVSVTVRFVQERRSGHAAEKLKAMVSNTATVLRREAQPNGPDTRATARKVEVPMADLVPGDIVLLSAGDMMPADCRILAAKDLFVAQAALTGESLPVEKFATQVDGDQGEALSLPNIVFMGTNVVSGSATAVVLCTGSATYFGALAQRVTGSDPEPTPFQAGVNQVAWILIRFMALMLPLVLLINGITKGDWAEAFLFAMSVAVGLTPEMLPMIVTSTLAKGAVALSRHQVVVKRLDAIQNFGAMDVLCTDKTGTLTQDRIFLARHIDFRGTDSDEVLEATYLNSYYQTGLKNLLDVAVLHHSDLHQQLEPAVKFRKIDEVPFDFQRRRMSVVVSGQDGRHQLICKGAIEEVLAVCTQVRDGAAEVPLTPAGLELARQVTARLNTDGMRVVAVASKTPDPTQQVYSVTDEAGLTLLGFVAFLDPPKESARAALKTLAAHGVQVKVLTGDSERVTYKICREVGLPDQTALLGSDIEPMSDDELGQAVERHAIFARLTPVHKERIVRALRANGHVVGFMGDGINDAPALRAADIGISVDSAVDIAKDAADIILLEKSLRVLGTGVVEGRKTFVNMLKYIKMTASSNFGNVLSVLVASAFIPFLPMLPMHLLVQNLLYDFSQVAIPFDRVDKDLVRHPQTWNPADIQRFMVCFGPVSSLFDIATFALMWWGFGANSVGEQTLFQSGWFVEGLMTQTLVVHLIRTRHVPFLQSRPSGALLATTVLIMALGVFLPMGPLAHYFKLQPLPWTYFPALAAILLGYMITIQGMKVWVARRYGWR